LLAVWIGLGHTLLSFVLGVLLGAVVALVRLRSVARRGKVENWALTKLPMGTFICVGGIVAGLWGDQIIAAYLHWANLRI
jgi:leader peptidase (prepilin peptidase) / N-methyltransferase